MTECIQKGSLDVTPNFLIDFVQILQVAMKAGEEGGLNLPSTTHIYVIVMWDILLSFCHMYS